MLEWIVSSSILIAVIIIGRRFLRGRVSCRVQYGLWLLVALRLLIPVSPFQSALSIANVLPENISTQSDMIVPIAPYAADPLYQQPAADPYSQPADCQDTLPAAGNYTAGMDKADGGAEDRAAGFGIGSVVGSIWLAGACTLAMWLAAVNGVFRSRVRRDRQMLEIPQELWRDLYMAAGRPEKQGGKTGADRKSMLPVYVTEQAGSPCMYGLFCPAVYVTPQVAADSWLLAMVLRHEQMHYRHGDHIWAVVRTLCLCIHWYNPLVWAAVGLSRQDGELACDEGVLRRLDQTHRRSYGEALLALSAGVKPTLSGAMNLATSMSGTKRQLRERLSALVTMPRMAAGTAVLVVLLSLGLAACTFTSRVDDYEENPAADRADAGAESGTDAEVPASGQPEDVFSESQEISEETKEQYMPPWILAEEYTGYLDEVGSEGRHPEYRDQDYDGDGLTDRIYQDVESEPGIMKMRVEFGNGEVLSFDTYENSPLMVQSMDLDGDGSRELLFTKPNDFSTNPMAIPADILLFTRREDGYHQVDTALETLPEDYPYYTSPTLSYLAVSYSKADDSHIRVNWNVPGAEGDLGKTQEYLRPADEWDMEYFKPFLESYYVPAYQAELIQERYAFLRIYFQGLERSGDRIWVDLTLGSDGLSPVSSSIYDTWTGDEAEAVSPESEAVYDSWDVQILEYRNEENRPVAEIAEGEAVTKLTYVETSWSLSAEEAQYSQEILYWACQALQELEQWTGTSLTEVCYSVSDFGDFTFAQTPGDMQHSRIFYSRCYSNLFGNSDVIEQIDYATDIDVWFSPVKQYVTPPGYDKMTAEEILTWYFERSAIARGSKVEEMTQPWEGDYIIRTDQGTYYEFASTEGIGTVGRGMCLYGPYDSYPQH